MNMILDKQLPMGLRAAILFARYCWSKNNTVGQVCMTKVHPALMCTANFHLISNSVPRNYFPPIMS